jgi:Secretion system C-terminal sorting domain
MKKSLLLFIAILVSATGYSQSLVVSSGSTLITGDANNLLQGFATVQNVSANTLDVSVEKTVNNLATGHHSSFCWGIICVDTATLFSPVPEAIAPGASNTTFYADLQPSGSAGTSVVTFRFYVDNNPSDHADITFTYDATLVGIAELLASGVVLTSPYPNPANSYAQIGCNLGSSKNAKIIIYNMLGSVVREIKIADKQNLVTISTAELKSGMYLYSLISNDKVIASKKLLVNH